MRFCKCPEWDIDEYSYQGQLMCVGCGKLIKEGDEKMVNFKFELGEEVKDEVTGYKGIVIGRTQWRTNCNTYGVKSKKLKDGIPQDAVWIDEICLSKTGKGLLKIKQTITGGPTEIPRQHSG